MLEMSCILASIT